MFISFRDNRFLSDATFGYNKIQAIKALKEVLSFGLREAKVIVDTIIRNGRCEIEVSRDYKFPLWDAGFNLDMLTDTDVKFLECVHDYIDAGKYEFAAKLLTEYINH